MWFVILNAVIISWIVSFLFICLRITKFLNNKWSKKKQFLFVFLFLLLIVFLITLCLNFINAIICVIYLAIIWGICDFIFWNFKKIFCLNYKYYYVGITAIILTIFNLCIGWYLAHNVWQTKYYLKNNKNNKNLKIVMFADSHIGTTFDGKSFAKHIKTIQLQNPDIVFVIGDYVDDSTSKQDMIYATKALGELKTKYGVYFVFGNHDKGYYGSEYRGFSANDLINELEKNGIKILRDEIALIDNSFYIIGRKDFSEEYSKIGKRKSIFELINGLDKNKYIIVLDHQPSDFENQALSKVDLVLSGHTHGGQLFPFNKVGKWLGVNDLVYGYEKRNLTNFIVTSGISDWAIKFKTGTKSEFVVIYLK